MNTDKSIAEIRAEENIIIARIMESVCLLSMGGKRRMIKILVDMLAGPEEDITSGYELVWRTNDEQAG